MRVVLPFLLLLLVLPFVSEAAFGSNYLSSVKTNRITRNFLSYLSRRKHYGNKWKSRSSPQLDRWDSEFEGFDGFTYVNRWKSFNDLADLNHEDSPQFSDSKKEKQKLRKNRHPAAFAEDVSAGPIPPLKTKDGRTVDDVLVPPQVPSTSRGYDEADAAALPSTSGTVGIRIENVDTIEYMESKNKEYKWLSLHPHVLATSRTMQLPWQHLATDEGGESTVIRGKGTSKNRKPGKQVVKGGEEQTLDRTAEELMEHVSSTSGESDSIADSDSSVEAFHDDDGPLPHSRRETLRQVGRGDEAEPFLLEEERKAIAQRRGFTRNDNDPAYNYKLPKEPGKLAKVDKEFKKSFPQYPLGTRRIRKTWFSYQFWNLEDALPEDRYMYKNLDAVNRCTDGMGIGCKRKAVIPKDSSAATPPKQLANSLRHKIAKAMGVKSITHQTFPEGTVSAPYPSLDPNDYFKPNERFPTFTHDGRIDATTLPDLTQHTEPVGRAIEGPRYIWEAQRDTKTYVDVGALRIYGRFGRYRVEDRRGKIILFDGYSGDFAARNSPTWWELVRDLRKDKVLRIRDVLFFDKVSTRIRNFSRT